MNHEASIPESGAQESLNTYQVRYTIQDGEYGYGDSFTVKSTESNSEERAYEALAELFACDDEDEKEIIAGLKSKGEAMIDYRAIKEVSVRVVEAVTIILRGGVIQDIQNIPAGTVIRVRDYDVENLTDVEMAEKTEPDEDGNPCMVSEWGG